MAPAMLPFRATWYPFTAYHKTQDRSPQSPIPGDFAAELDVPVAGDWTVAVIVRNGSATLAATGILPITSGQVAAGLGTKAVSTPTPVATSTSAIEAICTRTPVDHMHYISLDEALGNGLPTVVTFGTPLLCESRLCGPVTDEVLAVHDAVGEPAANFIHVEEFLPGPSHTPPPVSAENQSPPFVAWGLDTEPWTFLIDKTGVIRARYLGPIVASQIQAALQPLL